MLSYVFVNWYAHFYCHVSRFACVKFQTNRTRFRWIIAICLGVHFFSGHSVYLKYFMQYIVYSMSIWLEQLQRLLLLRVHRRWEAVRRQRWLSEPRRRPRQCWGWRRDELHCQYLVRSSVFLSATWRSIWQTLSSFCDINCGFSSATLHRHETISTTLKSNRQQTVAKGIVDQR